MLADYLEHQACKLVGRRSQSGMLRENFRLDVEFEFAFGRKRKYFIEGGDSRAGNSLLFGKRRILFGPAVPLLDFRERQLVDSRARRRSAADGGFEIGIVRDDDHVVAG